ncbi:Fe-S protein assembly co-chaperone HscB [Methylibium sp.]|uniref:Fe-S protein assembly co-chaperone HscB n=1 Tax=Methylibium sp. TaxID=2067992 RepID=UPI003D09C261
MKIDDDDFTLFAIAPRFVQDRAVLDARWKALQSEVHPDRFAAEGPAARRVAMQWAIRVNEAYQRLKDPLARAAYLCSLHGQALDAQTNTAMPAAFLMQQMAWREALEADGTPDGIEALAAEVSDRQRSLQDELVVLIDERQDWSGAASLIRALMFIARMAQDLDQRLDVLSR